MEAGEEIVISQTADEDVSHLAVGMDGNGHMATEMNTNTDEMNNSISESMKSNDNGTSAGDITDDDNTPEPQPVAKVHDQNGQVNNENEKLDSGHDKGGSVELDIQAAMSEEEKTHSETSRQNGSVNIATAGMCEAGDDQGLGAGQKSEINNNFEEEKSSTSTEMGESVESGHVSPVQQNGGDYLSRVNTEAVDHGISVFSEQNKQLQYDSSEDSDSPSLKIQNGVVSPSPDIPPDGSDLPEKELSQDGYPSPHQEAFERSRSPDLSDSKDGTDLQNLSVSQASAKPEQEITKDLEQEREDGNGREFMEDDDDDDADTVEGETDTSQFAQLIVQHVLGHAVSSFNANDSDHENSPHDTMDEGSLSSFPADEVHLNGQLDSPVVLPDSVPEIPQDNIEADQLEDNKDSLTEISDSQKDNSTKSCEEEFVYNRNGDVDVEATKMEKMGITEDGEAKPVTEIMNAESDAAGDVDHTDTEQGRQRAPSVHTSCDSSCGLPICPPLAAYPDFPENYGNYKVCRDIGPGMKECLILETGENVQCKKTKDGILLKKSDKSSEQIVLSEKEAQSFLEKLPDEMISRESNVATPTQEHMLESPRSVHDSPTSSHSSDSSRHKPFRIIKSPPKTSAPVSLSNNKGPSNSHASRQLFSEGPTVVHSQVDPQASIYVDDSHKQTGNGNNVISTSNFDRKYPELRTEPVHNQQNFRYDDGDSSSQSQEVCWGERTGYIVRALPDDDKGIHRVSAQQVTYPQETQHMSTDRKLNPDPQSIAYRPASPRVDPRILQSSTGYVHKEMSYENSIREQGLLESTSQHLPVLGQQALPEHAPLQAPYLQQRHFTEPPVSQSMSDRILDVPVRLPVTVGSDTQSYNLNMSDPLVYRRYQRNLMSREFQMENEGYGQIPPSTDYQHSFPVSQTYPSAHLLNNVNKSQTTSDGSFMELKQEPQSLTEDLTEAEKQYIAQLCSKYGLTDQPRYNITYGSPAHQEGYSSGDLSAASVPSSGPVPSFKTLQEQQASWMQMFETLEEKHQEELKQQFRQHQHSMFNMQHKMEEELYEQQQELRRKLKAHKEALGESLSQNMSLNSSGISSPSRHESSQSTTQRSHDQMVSTIQETSDQSAYRSPVRGREVSPSWREIYREVRNEMDLTDPSTESVSVRRSLENDFSSSSRSRSLLSPQRSSDSPQTRTRSHSSPPRAAGSPSRSPHYRSLSDGRTETSTDNLPRAGVYSSPMPILRGKAPKTKDVPALAKSSGSPSQSKSSARVASPSPSEIRQSSSLQRELENRHEELVQQHKGLDQELFTKSAQSDDVHLSSSMRVTLREKHAKHVADLREYYERELNAMRQVLKIADSERTRGQGSLTETQNLQLENRLLREKINDLEHSLETSDRRVCDLEQRLQGLEVRASDYADYYKEAQDKIANFRSTVEELQYNCREKDDVIERLDIDYKTQTEALKKSRQIQEEQANLIHKDRTALQKLVEKLEENERESSSLKESVANLENKLYDARAENVEMKRTISRLELENKRLARENDNLHHKVTNLSGLHNSFNESFTTHTPPVAMESPRQRTLHETSNRKSARDSSPFRQSNSELSLQRESPRGITSQRRSARDSSPRSHNTHQMNGSFHDPNDSIRIRTPTRNITRSPRPGSHDQTETNNSESTTNTSPLMRAEEELYRLRDVLRSTTPTSCDPVQPKIQKKFYGTDIVSPSRHLDRSPDRHIESPKTKKKLNSNVPSSSSKSRSRDLKSVIPTSENSTNLSYRTRSRKSQHSPSKEQSSQTRLDAGYEESRPRSSENARARSIADELKSRSSSNSRQPADRLPPDSSGITWSPSKLKSAANTRVKSSGTGEDGKKKKRREVTDSADNSSKVERTLQKVKAGEYVSRPQWEDMYASMTKGLTSTGQPLAKESKIRERIKSLGDMEHRYDDLYMEKRKLESALSKLPSNGRNWKQKEQLEDHLDKVERELGSIRMSLKRHNILKTS